MMILAKQWSCEQQANCGQSWELVMVFNWTQLSGADAFRGSWMI